MHVETFKGKGAQPWRFRLIADNHEAMAASEGYLTRWNAKRAARKAFPGVTVVDIAAKKP